MPYLAGFTTPQDFGAVGNGSTDDTAAINAALDFVYTTYGGGIVILPVTGSGYLVSAPITPPPYTFLVGQSAITLNLNLATPPANVSRLLASSAWAPSAAAGIVSFLSLTPGGWGENWASGGLRQIFIDGSQNSNTNLQGIQMTGPVYDVHLEDVLIYKAPHNGINASTQTESGITATFPYHQRYDRVTAANCGNSGFNLVNFTDSSLINCLAFGSVGNGFALQNNSNSVLTACRSEWSSGGRGYDVTGTSGSIEFTGCTTDQNFDEGLRIHAAAGQSTQGGGIIWTGGKLHLDGNGGTNPNGIKITGSTVPVTITGVNVESGQASGGSYYPTNAIEIDTSSNVTVSTCTLQGITSAWSDGGSNTVITRTGCIGATGNPSSQTFTVLPNLSSTLVVGATAPLGDNGVGEIQLANAGTVPTTNPTGGAIVYARNGGILTRDPNGTVTPLVAGPETAATTGALAESIPRTQVSASSAFTSGNLLIQSIYLPAGVSVGHIGFGTGTIAGATMTHWWAALLDNTYKQQAHSADQTSGAIGLSTWFNLAMATPFVTTYSGTYYLGLMIAASTMPTILQSGVTPAVQFWTGTGHVTPVPNGLSSTGLTTPGTDGTTVYTAPSVASAPYYMYATV